MGWVVKNYLYISDLSPCMALNLRFPTSVSEWQAIYLLSALVFGSMVAFGTSAPVSNLVAVTLTATTLFVIGLYLVSLLWRGFATNSP